ncbi:alpha/beta hydrolase family protein [Georgenia subflava]|uniref:Alpha/beta fold hydrolase n=1 Tax=Georgenia subflava TaxID=1622177 RepID=A0A6N7EM62_9MICO|nr:alpha/beta fold hydrolase [Georgenia subflava]MPV39140.1 alpha/beta fold hydrolase [Georgenia subflava]
MIETNLTFESGSHTLAGTLTTPAGTGPFPTVLLIPGSGPVDRDSDHKRMPLGVTRELAEALDRAGVATFRYDKRGVGQSTGRWRAAGFLDNIDDARAALDTARARPEVDADQVILLGHSEGALLATAVAGATGTVAGVVLVSPSAKPGDEALAWQAEQIGPTLPKPVQLVLRLLRTDLATRSAKNRAKIRQTTADEAWVDGTKLNARWTREFMAYDPGPDLAKITVPVLAVTGTKDLQVDVADLERVADLVPGPVETHAVADVNHILRSQPGPASLSTYKKDIRRPVDPRVVEHVTDWVSRQVRAAGRVGGAE